MKYRGYELVVYSEIVEGFDGYGDVDVYSGEIRKNGTPVAFVYDGSSSYDVESEAKTIVDEMLEGEDE